jgi:hypothetical protein
MRSVHYLNTEEADIQGMERFSRVASVDAQQADDVDFGSLLPSPVVDHLGAQQLKDLLTEQQQRSIADMYNLLRKGEIVVCHLVKKQCSKRD